MAEPTPTEVAPWYLRNINQALALDEASGNVYVRTGFQGNIIISGNVNIPGNIDAHISEIGTSGNLTVPWMPVSIDGNANVTVTSGNITLQTGSNYVGQFNISDGSHSISLELNNNDGEATTTYSVPVENYNMVYNGTSWDRMRGNVANGVQVYVTNPLDANITGGNVNANVTGSTVGLTGNLAGITANVNIGTMPNVNANITGGNVNAAVTGTVTATQGTDPWAISGNVVIDSGNVTVNQQPGAQDLFGEPYAITITPTIQIDGIFGIDPELIQTYTGGGGNVSTANGIFECSSTSTVGSYAVCRSRRFNTFRPGQSMIGRWLTAFGTPAAGTSQRIGLNNQEQGFYIGYNGTTFGILHAAGGKTPLYKVTVTSYTGSQNVTLTLNGTPYTIAIVNGETIDNAAQRIASANFGGTWLATQQDNTVLLTYAGTIGPLGGTFSISSSGNLVAAVTTVQVGVAATNTWYLDGTLGGFNKPSWLVPTNYVSYAIKYAWAGAYFYAYNPSTQEYEFLWAIGGSAGALPLANPTFKAATVAYNTGGSTAVTTSTAAMFMGLEGIESLVNNTSGASSSQANLSQNVIHHCMTIQNPYVYANKTNTLQASMSEMSVSFQVNDPSQIFIYIDQALDTGLQDFVSQDGKPISVSTVTGTFSASAVPVASFIVGNTGAGTQFDLQRYRMQLAPGQTLSIGCYSTATINKCAISMVWNIN